MTCGALAITGPDPARLSEGGEDVALAAGGDRHAFERLYRSHVGRVYSVCVRMSGDGNMAEELTQDVFVRAWHNIASFRGESAFATWLHRLAVNVVLNARTSDERATTAPWLPINM
ncbi:MAG: hypothetical protein NVS1B4_18290 [Gemmatimonadaceae bacterium]